MKLVEIKFKKSYNTYKAGSTVKTDGSTAEFLTENGIATTDLSWKLPVKKKK